MATARRVPRGGFNPVVHRPDGVTEITLTQGKTALVDTPDWENLKWHRWCAVTNRHGNWYAETGCRSLLHKTGYGTVRMHFLLTLDQRDHKNGNGLDNRRENLRRATASQNSFNCKKREHKWPHGVTYNRKLDKWVAQITVRYRNIYLGIFGSPEEARAARIEGEKKFYPGFERLAN